MAPIDLHISHPVLSSKFSSALPSTNSTYIHARYDILVWFEICELASSGEYVPAMVEISDNLPCRGIFLLHQGIQRRIRVTIIHENSFKIKWLDVRELVIGRIRNSLEQLDASDHSTVLSLGLFPREYLKLSGDRRNIFRFEAAWDSSLHNSPLLNRVTSYGEQVFLTISAYIEVSFGNKLYIDSNCFFMYKMDFMSFER